jgi:Protein of unknown function (DUF2892)
MIINEGKTDRTLRIIVGIVLLGLTLVLEGNLRWLGLIGLVPLATGILGNCPVYTLLGMNTCPAQKT